MKIENAINNQKSLFNEPHSTAIRIWHWTFFLVVTSTIVVVLFASNVFDMRDNISMVQEQVQQKGGAITSDQARAVAHEYSDKLWNIHKYIGYIICFLLLSRMLIEFFQSKEEKLSSKIKNAFKFSSTDPKVKTDRQHFLIVKYGYLAFYLMILVMATTGLGLAYEDVPFLDSIHKPLKNIHSFTQYLIYFYILSHLVGVVRADLTNHKGIVSGMINGNKS